MIRMVLVLAVIFFLLHGLSRKALVLQGFCKRGSLSERRENVKTWMKVVEILEKMIGKKKTEAPHTFPSLLFSQTLSLQSLKKINIFFHIKYIKTYFSKADFCRHCHGINNQYFMVKESFTLIHLFQWRNRF